MKEEIVNNVRQELRSLEKRLGVLETIASVSPILGLLGTVVGMIKVFSVITSQGVGNAWIRNTQPQKVSSTNIQILDFTK